ncbi:MAG: nitroreductase/quinone reductase family protein [SAR202 cluster bacterium]|jgi:deazaflavin-dependent oxidoreductase (nitroreductase family)|nr:nitroreductase/quinone reductase family protein [SAR202 cluster bacterium]MDP6512010.1 nitroreductase/quinone reductase family protein [SAR202 cluster bacterium]MDP6715727.1 nitroreductase/quinone reductase family protein [SAR202 cluster bacterium]
MDERVQQGLEQDRTIDITTKGRKSGQDRRVEIWFHNLDGKYYITGTPGTRDWYANMAADPEMTFHLKKTVQADIPARARPITDDDERKQVFLGVFEKLEGDRDLDDWMANSPLVEVELDTDNAQVS